MTTPVVVQFYSNAVLDLGRGSPELTTGNSHFILLDLLHLSTDLN